MWRFISKRGTGRSVLAVGLAVVLCVVGFPWISPAAAATSTAYVLVSASSSCTSAPTNANFGSSTNTTPCKSSLPGAVGNPVDIVPGTTITANANVTNNPGTWKAVIRCHSGGAAYDTAGADKAGANTSTVTATCYGDRASMYVYTNTSGATVTANDVRLVVTVVDVTAPPVTPSPAPTAAPLPTGAVGTPVPTAPPDIEFDDMCGDGAFSVPDADHMKCHYGADAEQDEGGSYTEEGPLCRSGWLRTISLCRVEDGTVDKIGVVTTVGGSVWLMQSEGVRADWMVGAFGVQVHWYMVCNTTSGDHDCDGITVNASVAFWSSTGGLLGSAGDIIVAGAGEDDDWIGFTGYFSEPEGTTYVTVDLAVSIPASFGTFDTDSFTYVSAVAIQWTFDPEATVTDNGPSRCPDGSIRYQGPTLGGQQGWCPGDGTYDGSGGVVCGPLSGDCTKPFIGSDGLPTCNAPTSSINPLDWFGWLGCLLSIIPALLWSEAVVPLLNVFIDLLVAGDVIGPRWALFKSEMDTRFPISWIGPVAATIETAYDDIETGGDLPASLTVFGRTLSPYAGAGSITEPLAAFRPIQVSIIWLWFVIFVVKRLGAFVGSGGGSHVSIDNAG